MTELKPRKCKNPACRTKFVPDRQFIVWCSPECGAILAKAKIERQNELRAKKARKEHKEAKEKAKTLTEWKNEVQAVFNRYIVLRDGKKCITCGTQNPNIQYAAGHYRTVKAAGHLRYNEDNVNTQCNYRCNSMLSGNIAAYRPALIAKIGIDRVEALENDNREHRYTVEELKEIKATYRKKANELLKGIENGMAID